MPIISEEEFKKLVTSTPPQGRILSEEEFMAIGAPSPVKRTALGKGISAVGGGLADIGEMVGRAARATDQPGGMDIVRGIGEGLVTGTQALKERFPILKPSPDTGFVEEGIRSGITSMGIGVPLAVAGYAAGNIPGAAAAFTAGPAAIFGLAEKDRFMEEANAAMDAGIAPRLSKEELNAQANKAGLVEGGLEALSNALGFAFLGAGKLAKQPLKASIKAAIKPAALAKTYPKLLAEEIPTEVTQEEAGAKFRRDIGVPAGELGEGIKVIPSVAVSTLLFGLVGKGLDTVRRNSIVKALDNPEHDVKGRIGAVNTVAAEIEKSDPATAKIWKEKAYGLVANKQAIPDDIASLTKPVPPPPTGPLSKSLFTAATDLLTPPTTEVGATGIDVIPFGYGEVTPEPKAVVAPPAKPRIAGIEEIGGEIYAGPEAATIKPLPQRLAEAIDEPKKAKEHLDLVGQFAKTEDAQAKSIIDDTVKNSVVMAEMLANKGKTDRAVTELNKAIENGRKLKLADGPETESHVDGILSIVPRIQEKIAAKEAVTEPKVAKEVMPSAEEAKAETEAEGALAPPVEKGPSVTAVPSVISGVTASEVDAIKDIPTTEKMKQAIALVGDREFKKQTIAKIQKYRPADEHQKAMLVEATAIEIIAKGQRIQKELPAIPATPYSSGAKVKVGRNPQPHTIINEAPFNPQTDQPGERYFNLRNDKTGEETGLVGLDEIAPIKGKGEVAVKKEVVKGTTAGGYKPLVDWIMKNGTKDEREIAHADGKTVRKEIRYTLSSFLPFKGDAGHLGRQIYGKGYVDDGNYSIRIEGAQKGGNRPPSIALIHFPEGREGKPIKTALPSVTVTPPVEKAKEQWEMGKEEYVERYMPPLDSIAAAGMIPAQVKGRTARKDFLKKSYAGTHKRLVQNALSDGLPVPDSVLADYPELQAKPPVEKAILDKIKGKASDDIQIRSITPSKIKEGWYDVEYETQASKGEQAGNIYSTVGKSVDDIAENIIDENPIGVRKPATPSTREEPFTPDLSAVKPLIPTYTDGSLNIMSLAGAGNVKTRMKIMALLKGEKVISTKSTVTLLQAELAKVGIEQGKGAFNFKDEVKSKHPDFTDEDISYIARETAAQFEQVAARSKGEDKGIAEDAAKAWNHFAETGELPLAKKGQFVGQPKTFGDDEFYKQVAAYRKTKTASEKAPEEIEGADLNVDDTFTSNGELHTVVAETEDGKLKITNGKTEYVWPDETVEIDKGSLKKAEVKKEIKEPPAFGDIAAIAEKKGKAVQEGLFEGPEIVGEKKPKPISTKEQPGLFAEKARVTPTMPEAPPIAEVPQKEELPFEGKEEKITPPVIEEKKPPIKKLESTDVAIRRYWEAKNDRIDAVTGETDKVLAAIYKETNRADLMEVPLAEDATPGARRYVDLVRSEILLFKDWIVKQPGIYKRYGRKVKGFDVIKLNMDSGDLTIENVKELAKSYIEKVKTINQSLAGSSDIQEAANKLDAVLFKKTEKGPTGAPRYVKEATSLREIINHAYRIDASAYYVRDLIEEETKETSKRDKKTPLIRPSLKLEDIHRKDLPDYRNGKDVAGEDIKRTFGIASVTYGEYANAKERQLHTNHSFDALHDLAKTLGIKPTDIGLGGTLHYAIGALGHGQYAATYHHQYPMPDGKKVNVINLTKSKGDGSLAHEWGHALDFYLKQKTGGTAFIDNITKALRRNYDNDYATKYIDRFLEGHTFYKHLKGNPEAGAAHWLGIEARSTEAGKATLFFKESTKLGDYWEKPVEMFARAFESYVYDKQSGETPYLVNGWVADGATKPPTYKGTPYPVGDERVLFNGVFDTMLQYLDWTADGPVVKGDVEESLDNFKKYRQHLESLRSSLSTRAKELEEKRIAKELERRAKERGEKKVEEKPITPSSEPKNLFEGMGDEDIESMMNEVVAEEFPEKVREVREKKAERKPTAEGEAKKPVVDEPSYSAVLKDFSDSSIEGAAEFMKGIYEVFGGGKIKSFPAGLDKEAYDKAKPHFIAAYNATMKAGHSAHEFVRLLVKAFGDKIKPYLSHFIKEVRDGRVNFDDGFRPRPTDVGADGGKGVSKRPGLVVVKEQDIPKPRTDVTTDRGIFRKELDTHQQLGVNLALDRFLLDGKRGFLLADGTGTGKTRQILAIAQVMHEMTGKPTLVVTQSKQVIDGSFTNDSKPLGISITDPKKIELITYSDLSGKKGGLQEYGLAVFDEAHNLKNLNTNKTVAALNIKSAHRLYATATPMDRPTAATYFLSEITGKPQDQIMREIGIGYEEYTDKFTGEVRKKTVLLEGHNWEKVLDNIITMRDESIEKGSLLRREYPFYGEVETSDLTLTMEELIEQDRIDIYWNGKINAARGRLAKMNLAGQRIGELSRWLESKKIDRIFDIAVKDYEAGKKVVIVGEGVNDTELKALPGAQVQGLLSALAKRFGEKGIKFAKVYGTGDKSKEVAKFQSGEVSIVLATPQSGGTGINLDDVVGDKPRNMYIATMNFSGDVFQQILGRVSRKMTQSPSMVKFLNFTNGLSDKRRKEILDKKVATLKAIQGGEDVDRALGLEVEAEPSTVTLGSGFGALQDSYEALEKITVAKIKDAIPHLENIGNSVYKAGMKYADFAKSMKTALGEMWEKFRSQMIRVYQSVKAKFKEERGSFSTKEIEDTLIQEARKYESAEEFAKSKINAYHGTYATFKEFKRPLKAGVEKEPTLQPIFLAKDVETAKSFAYARGGQVIGVAISPKAKLFDFEADFKTPRGKSYDESLLFIEIENHLIKNGLKDEVAYSMAKNIARGDWDSMEDSLFQKYLLNKRYDGFYAKENRQKTIGVINTDVLKTEFQLTDIWNKANKPVSPALSRAEGKGLTKEENLAIVHNLTKENLRHVLKMGGLPVPSTAIIDVKKSKFEGFGDITLVANKDVLGPEAGREHKYFDADVYSPRYPRISHFLTPKSSKVLDGYLDPIWEGIPSTKNNQGGISSHYSFIESIKERGIEQSFAEGDSLLYYAFLKERGDLPDNIDRSWESKNIIRDKVEKEIGKEKYEEWALAKAKELGLEADEKIFNGFTYSGNKRYLKHDLDTVVRILKKELKDGEGFNYGVPSIRAKAAKQFRTIKQIQAARERIISKEDMGKIKAEADNEFTELAEKAIPFLKHKRGFGDFDTFSEHIKEAIETHNFNRVFGEKSEYYTPGLDYKPIIDFVNKLHNLPTEYFEGKIQRAVGLNEFNIAIVPNDTPQDLIDQLKTRGLSVETYKIGDADDRQAKIEAAARRESLLFSRAEGKGPGLEVAKIESTLAPILKNWKNKPTVNVIKTLSDIPQHLQDRMKRESGELGAIEGMFDPKDKSVYLVADNIESTDRAIEVLFHESLGHYGLRGLMGENIKPLLNVVWREKNAEARQIAKAYELDVDAPGIEGYNARQTAAEEVLARMAQEDVTPPLLKRILSAIRNWMRRVGFDIQLTDDDLKKIVYDAAQYVRTGDKPLSLTGMIAYSMREEAKPFYSQLERVIEDKIRSAPDKKVDPDTFKGLLSAAGIKQDELTNTKIKDFLEGKKVVGEKVSKNDVLAYLKEQRTELKDVVLGEPEFKILSREEAIAMFPNVPWVKDEQWVAVDRGEPLFNVPDANTREEAFDFARQMYKNDLDEDRANVVHFSQYQEPGGTNYREMFVTAPDAAIKGLTEEELLKRDGVINVENKNEIGAFWQDGHPQYADIQNPVVRVRFNERTDDAGRKILFIEEMQGPKGEKWHEVNGKKYDDYKEALKAADGDVSKVEKKFSGELAKMTPFLRERQYDIGVKRALKYAADNGFDGISWTPGEVQANRYDLSKQVDKISAERTDWGGYHIVIDRKEAMTGMEEVLRPEELEEYVGKEFAQKIISQPDGEQVYSGLDLKVGGEGLMSLYDKILPKKFQEITKGKVGETTFGKGLSYDEIQEMLQDFDKYPSGSAERQSLRKQQEAAQDFKTMTVPFIPVPKEAAAGYPLFSRETEATEGSKLASKIEADRASGNFATEEELQTEGYSEQEEEAYRKLTEEDDNIDHSGHLLAKDKKEIWEDAKKTVDRAIGIISTRLGNIHPRIKAIFREHQRDLAKAIAEDLDAGKPFIEKFKKLPKNVRIALSNALLDGRKEDADIIAKRHNLLAEMKVAGRIFDTTRNRAIEAGLEVGKIDNYWARVVKNPKKLLAAIRGTEHWSGIDAAIKRIEKGKGPLSEVEKSIIIDQVLRGYPANTISLTSTSHLKERKFKQIPKKYLEYYMSADQSLLSYITSMNNTIEAAKFFGKSRKPRYKEFIEGVRKEAGEAAREENRQTGKMSRADYWDAYNKYVFNAIKEAKLEADINPEIVTEAGLDDSIGTLINDLMSKGLLDPAKEQDVRDMAQAVFRPARTGYGVRAYKNLTYLQLLTQFIPAITQIQDIALSAEKAGYWNTLKVVGKVVSGKADITIKDVHIENLMTEIDEGQDKLAKALEWSLRKTGFTWMDKIGKETLLNASLLKFQRQAQANDPKLKAMVDIVFEEHNPEQVMKDLAAGVKNDDTLLMLFNELSDQQPITVLEVPEKYLTAKGIGKTFYALKTYQLKLFDVYRRDIWNEYKNGNKAEAGRKLFFLTAALILMGVGTDEIKDFILGREADWDDRAWDNGLKLIGLSKYTIYKAKKEGFGEALLAQFAPPMGIINPLAKDVDELIRKGEIEKGARSTANVPIAGKMYYWWLGRGAEQKAEEREKREKQEKIRTRLGEIGYKKYQEREEKKALVTRLRTERTKALKRADTSEERRRIVAKYREKFIEARGE